MRKEVDLLGEKEVPDNVYYGVHTLRAMENFHISDRTINNYPEFIRGMVMIKKACAMANKELGAIPSDVGDAIIKASDAILVEKKYMDQFPVDVFQGGAGTSVNMNTNEVLANIGLEMMGHKKGEYKYLNPNDHVNEGQSTNDAYPSGLRLAIYNSIMQMLCPLEKLQKGFECKAAEFDDILKLGRTQLQDAVPMTLGQEFMAFANLLRDDRQLIKKLAPMLLTVNLGGTAIGTGLNAHKGFSALSVKKLSEVTGYDCKLAEDLIEATSDTSDFVLIHGCLKRLAVKMCKICNDLRLLSSGPRAGLKEINLPELQAGSSIMPAKVNPVLPEVVNQVCYKVIGNDTCIMLASENGQLQLNVMEPVIAQAMFESISLLSSAFTNLLEKCVSGITVNKKRCEDYAMNSITLVTFLNPLIGHQNGDIIGKKCAETGKSVREIVIEGGYLSEDKLDQILNIQAVKKSVYPENAKPIAGCGAEGMRGEGCTQSTCPSKKH